MVILIVLVYMFHIILAVPECARDEILILTRVDVISSACTKWIRTGYLDDSDTRKFVFLKLLFHVLKNAEFQKLVFSNEKEEVDLTGDDDENQMIDDVDGSQPGDADDGSQPGDADDGSQPGDADDDEEEKGKTAEASSKINCPLRRFQLFCASS